MCWKCCAAKYGPTTSRTATTHTQECRVRRRRKRRRAAAEVGHPEQRAATQRACNPVSRVAGWTRLASLTDTAEHMAIGTRGCLEVGCARYPCSGVCRIVRKAGEPINARAPARLSSGLGTKPCCWLCSVAPSLVEGRDVCESAEMKLWPLQLALSLLLGLTAGSRAAGEAPRVSWERSAHTALRATPHNACCSQVIPAAPAPCLGQTWTACGASTALRAAHGLPDPCAR